MEKESLKNRIILRLSRSLVVNDASILRKVISENLGDIAQVFEADRALIFHTEPDVLTFSVAFEWHQDGFPSVIKSLQQLNLSDYMIWGKFGTKGSCFQISNTNNIPDSYPFDSKLFRDTGCNAFIQKALSFDNNNSGFVALLKKKAGHRWNPSQEEFLEIVSELLKNLILKLNSLTVSVRTKTAPASENFLRLNGKTEKEIAVVFDKLYGSLHYGVMVFDTTLQDFIYTNNKGADLLGIAPSGAAYKTCVFSVFRSNGYSTNDFFSPEKHLVVKDFALRHQNRYLNGVVSPVKMSSWVVMSFTD
ncbi:MAG: hypothetical protein EA361_05655, partial [Bacteroidetes bacterium]